MDNKTKVRTSRITIDPSTGPVWRVRLLRKGLIALTFDDGPHPDTTPIILEILERYQVKANFFLVGKEADNHPDLVRKICEGGHIVGSHSFDHQDLTTLEVMAARADIIAGHQAVRRISGTSTPFFRFPQLKKNQALNSILWELGLIDFEQDIDCKDWCASTKDEIVKSVCAQYEYRQNGIVILHDGIDNSCQALPVLIESLADKAQFGYFDWIKRSPDRFTESLNELEHESDGNASRQNNRSGVL